MVALTISAGVTHDVNGGGSETGDVVLSGGVLDVASLGSGGAVQSTTVESGGLDQIFDGVGDDIEKCATSPAGCSSNVTTKR